METVRELREEISVRLKEMGVPLPVDGVKELRRKEDLQRKLKMSEKVQDVLKDAEVVLADFSGRSGAVSSSVPHLMISHPDLPSGVSLFLRLDGIRDGTVAEVADAAQKLLRINDSRIGISGLKTGEFDEEALPPNEAWRTHCSPGDLLYAVPDEADVRGMAKDSMPMPTSRRDSQIFVKHVSDWAALEPEPKQRTSLFGKEVLNQSG